MILEKRPYMVFPLGAVSSKVDIILYPYEDSTRDIRSKKPLSPEGLPKGGARGNS